MRVVDCGHDVWRSWRPTTTKGVLALSAAQLAGCGVDEDEALETVTVPEREFLGDKAAVGMTQHDGALDTEVVEQRSAIVETAC